MKALILDTETTGLTPPPSGKDRCIEVGCILYDLVLAAPLASFSSLIRSDANAAEAINRIPVAALREAPLGEGPTGVWDRVLGLAERAEVILAHRAEFDRGFVPLNATAGLPWVCTKFHVEWPGGGAAGEHLVHLALAQGVGVVAAHRALTDCDLIARTLSRVHERGVDLVRLIQRAMRPRKKVAAIVSYEEREKAKAAGFAWDPAAKLWHREVPVEDIAALPFQTRPL